MNKTFNALLTTLALVVTTTLFGQSENLLEDMSNSTNDVFQTIGLWVGIIGVSIGTIVLLLLVPFRKYGYFLIFTGLIGFALKLILMYL